MEKGGIGRTSFSDVDPSWRVVSMESGIETSILGRSGRTDSASATLVFQDALNLLGIYEGK